MLNLTKDWISLSKEWVKAENRMELFDKKLEQSIKDQQEYGKTLGQSIKELKEFSRVQNEINKYFLKEIRMNGNKK
jgi:hypothetical protein